MQILFWISLFLLFYTYIGYGLLLLLYNAFFRRRSQPEAACLPSLTVVVPAYNEEDVIGQKIENTLALDYPADKISFVFVTDGSTDRTPAIVKTHPRIRLVHQPLREGKAAAINRAVRTVQTEIIVFSDANTMVHPQSLKKMVRHYGDDTVGGVAGEKRIATKASSPVGFGEGLYWQYESLLKKANSDFYTVVGAAGELLSVRASLFQPLDERTVLDDLVLSAGVCLQGCRFLYEAEAYGTETFSATVAEEAKRKVRISAGCYQALFALPALLNPARDFRLALQYLSHRVLRWVACPVALPVLLASNAALFTQADSFFYGFCFWGQFGFYLLAATGRVLAGRNKRARFLLLPNYFVFMVLCQYAGFARFLTGRQPVLWEKARRQPAGKSG